MLLWINGAFGAGKTSAAFALHRRLPGSFVFDPENLGFFLRENLPPVCQRPDFQQMPLWREGNFLLLRELCRQYSGTVIVPMTLADPGYEAEILGRLESCGVEVGRFLLSARRETILRRLKKRSLGRLSRESFAVEALDRCLDFFQRAEGWTALPTDDLTAEQTAQALADLAGLALTPDTRRGWRRRLDGLLTTLRHLR